MNRYIDETRGESTRGHIGIRAGSAVLAILCAIVLSSAASAADTSKEPLTRVVSYADLHLNGQPGAKALYGRLRHAARQVRTWHRPTRALFEDLDPELWEKVSSNPHLMLRRVDQQHLDRAAADPDFIARCQKVIQSFDAYVQAPAARSGGPLVAYFCTEFGFHESLPLYSGGLGVLTGDYCKAASDERKNFVAVGLLYRQGCFVQSVDSDGTRHARYTDSDPHDLPVQPVLFENGEWLRIQVEIGGRLRHDVPAVWRRRGGANPPGNRARNRWRAGAARARPCPVRVAHQRRARGIPDSRVAA